MSFKTPLPDHVIRLIEQSQRQALGMKTSDEHIAEAEIKSEKELHKQVANLLRLRGIEFFDSRTDKRTTRPKGEPDFTFAVWVKDFNKERQITDSWPIACSWELKIAGRPLSEEQQQMFKKMTTHPNAWCCRTIRNVDEALAELKRLGL